MPFRALLLGALILSGIAPASAVTRCDPGEGLTDRLIRHEGWRECVYHDQYGNPTIGVGHLLKRPADPELCWGGARIHANLSHDIERAEDAARHDLGQSYYALPDTQRAVLIEMAFQIGGRGLAHFTRMLDAARAGDYALAAQEILNSKLAHQTPVRAAELACLMEKQ